MIISANTSEWLNHLTLGFEPSKNQKLVIQGPPGEDRFQEIQSRYEYFNDRLREVSSENIGNGWVMREVLIPQAHSLWSLSPSYFRDGSSPVIGFSRHNMEAVQAEGSTTFYISRADNMLSLSMILSDGEFALRVTQNLNRSGIDIFPSVSIKGSSHGLPQFNFETFEYKEAFKKRRESFVSAYGNVNEFSAVKAFFDACYYMGLNPLDFPDLGEMVKNSTLDRESEFTINHYSGTMGSYSIRAQLLGGFVFGACWSGESTSALLPREYEEFCKTIIEVHR